MGQKRQDDARDDDELGQGGEFIPSELSRDGKEVFLDLHKNQDGNQDQHDQPVRLQIDEGRQAVGDQGDNDGGQAKILAKPDLAEIVDAQKDGEYGKPRHEWKEGIGRNNVQNESENPNEGKGPVRPEDEFSPFIDILIYVVAFLFETDQEGEKDDDEKINQIQGEVFQDEHHPVLTLSRKIF